MTTTLILARHGETIWHSENRYAGSSDVAMTPKGFEQAKTLGLWASTQDISAVYSSDLSRAILTATPAAEALGLELQVDPRVREIDFGDGEGLTPSEMDAAFPHAAAAFHARPAHNPFPNGESGVQGLGRAWPALQEIAAGHPDQKVLIVMHGTLLRLLICDGIGMPTDHYRWVFPDARNAAVTTISLEKHGMALHGYNVPAIPGV